MENQTLLSNEKFEKFTWTINEFSKLKPDNRYTESFNVGGYQWAIEVNLFDNAVNQEVKSLENLSIYLELDDHSVKANLPQGWSITTNLKLSIINQRISKLTKTIAGQMKFSADDLDCYFGWHNHSLSKLYEGGFVLYDTLIIVAKISVKESGQECQLDNGARTNDSLDSEFHRGLAKIDEDIAQLLDKACLHHPSLIECQKNRTRSAFTALGRVLYFLKTKKVKDMNDDACAELENLWEELGVFGFDLVWLEPHIRSALSMKDYMKIEAQVNKLKEDMINLEVEMNILKAKMTEEGFDKIDLNDELGCGV